MRMSTFAAGVFAAIAAAGVAMAQGQEIKEQLNGTYNCFVMKQHVIAVSDSRVAALDNAGPVTTIYSNRSGVTAHSIEAVHDVVAGDTACENNDPASARKYYQRAIDELTSPN